MADIQELLDVMAQLRNPDGGCDWDLQQNFATIAPFTIEEAYEVADAIEKGDLSGLRDELGDLLLQVVFHSRMAEELGEFVFSDVVQSIVDKMIRRHPHVFGDDSGEKPRYESTAELKQAWEAGKALEREKNPESSGPVSALAGVAVNLPALTRAAKIQKRAARVGFDWDQLPPVQDKVQEEIAELSEALQLGNKEDIEDELGDLLFSVVNLARHISVDPEVALRRATTKFSNRFQLVEEKARKAGLDLDDQPLEVLDRLWDEVKADAIDASAKR